MLAALGGFAALTATGRYAAAERDLTELVTTRASLAERIIERAGVGSVTLGADGSTLSAGVRSLLDEFSGYYVIITDDGGRTLYRSDAMRRLYVAGYYPDSVNLSSAAAEPYRNDYDSVRTAAFSLQASGGRRRVRLTTGEILMTARVADPPPPGRVSRIAVGVSTQRLRDVTTQTLALLALAGPLIIVAALWLAWLATGKLLDPIDRMVDDVAAIADGRSLHRRVVLEVDARDEFGRLAQTVNEMIGRLETSFASLRRFTADASHELRTPLAVIRADVERAMTTPQNSHEQAVALEEALQEVSRMTGLVESLLTLARADEGRFALVHEPVPLEPMMREVAETAAILGEEMGITVRMPRIESATVSGDPVRLRQLFLNLATNAIKYTPQNGTVEISLETRHDEAIVTVKDDGIGIAAADLPFIFDRFWRVDRARSRTEGAGVGLGLAICQWIAHAHDGRIDVASRLGRGSAFTIVLPLAQNAMETPNTGLSIS